MCGLGATNPQASFSRGERTPFLMKHKGSEYMFAVPGVESRLTFRFTHKKLRSINHQPNLQTYWALPIHNGYL